MIKQCLVVVCIVLLSACGGNFAKKPNFPAPDVRASSPSVDAETKPSTAPTGKGGYYLDDGPGDNAPADIDSIPDAQLKTEVPLTRANKPYSALGQEYMPMTSYAPYVKQGVASWYGKRYHGKKTSSGEIYDMYAMTGAHTTLPIPSYVKVTNPANGHSVVIRINDRGPFKHERLIDLSYAAAYKLRLTTQGSGLVEVQAIDTSSEALQKITHNRTELKNSAGVSAASYYVQTGAFESKVNGDWLQKKILSLNLADNAAVTNVYNGGLYRVKLGPFNTKQEADVSANKVRQQLNISAIVTNQ